MPKQPSPEAIDAATAFLHELWNGAKPLVERTVSELSAHGTEEQLLQATVARSMLSKWDALSIALVRDPQRLRLQEPDILRSGRALDLPLLTPGEPPTTIPVRYSIVTGLVDRVSQGASLPGEAARAAPQVRFSLTEMYLPDQEKVRTALEGIEESVAATPDESVILTDADVTYLGILARRIQLVGKATWARRQAGGLKRVWTWDLQTLSLGQAVSGMAVVHSELRFGKKPDEVRRGLHDISYDHSALDAGILALLGAKRAKSEGGDSIGAVEPFIGIIKKILKA